MPKAVQVFFVLAASLISAVVLGLFISGAQWGLTEPWAVRKAYGPAIVLFIVFAAAGLVVVHEANADKA